jgi:hypothetical protein
MADFDQIAPFPAHFATALRAVVNGTPASWPASATREERHSIELHGMLPIVYACSRMPALRDAAFRSAAVEALRLADLREMLGALREANVVPLIVKGTALAYSIYDAPELRPRSDTDLLIDANDIDRLRAALAPLGFREPLTSGDDLGVRQRSFERSDRFGVAHSYDVHLDIANPAVVARSLTYDELKARAVPLPRIAEGAIGPSNVDSLLYACIHRVVHHHDSERLMWLYDVHLLAARLSVEERNEFWVRAADRRIIAICKRTLELASEWFGGDETLLREAPEVRDREPSSAFLIHDRTRGAVLATELRALTWRERAQRLRQLAFPPPAFMRQRFGNRGAAMLPFLYAWRAMRGLARLFGRL